jgi:hypothetical protein
MSLKTTPKGLLAALAVLCILVLQIPLLNGQAGAAPSASAPHAAVPSHSIAAAVAHSRSVLNGVNCKQRAVGVAPTSQARSHIRSHTLNTSTTSAPMSLGGTLAITPASGPVGSNVQITGSSLPTSTIGQTVTVVFTDSAGTHTVLPPAAFTGITATLRAAPAPLARTFAVTDTQTAIAISQTATEVAVETATAAPTQTATAAANQTATAAATQTATAAANQTATAIAIASATATPVPPTPTATPPVTILSVHVLTGSNGLGVFTDTVTIPIASATGPGTLSASVGGDSGTVSYTVNAKVEAVSPNTGTLCTPVTLSLTDYAPNVPLTATLVYSVSGAITVTNAFLITPTAQSAQDTTQPPGAGNATGGTGTTIPFSIPNTIPYGTVVSISLTAPATATYPTIQSQPMAASYPTTPTSGAYATFTVYPAPSLGINANGSGTNATNSVGVTNTLQITSTSGSAGSFLPNQPISLTIGIPGAFQSTVAATAPVTTDVNGAFTATVLYTPTTPGTYVITATEGVSATSPGCNVGTGQLLVSVAAAPVSTSYFAEGYTGQGTVNFSETLSLLNPNATSVLVTDTYLLETSNEDITTTPSLPDVVVVTHTLLGLTDVSVNVAADIGSQAVITGPDAGKVVSGLNQKVATIVQTAGFAGTTGTVKGVAAERIMTRMAGASTLDGDVSLGTTSANSSYYFAEGYTGSGFQEYVLLLNPSPTVSATVTINRAPEGAASTLAPLGPYVLAPRQRLTLNLRRLNVDSPERSIGLIINSTLADGTTPTPIVAERVQYFGPGNGSAKNGETIAAGVSTAAKQLSFAYSSVTGISDTATSIPPMGAFGQTIDDRAFVEVMNPNIAGQVIAGTLSGSAAAPGPAAHVTIQLRGEDGRLEGFFTNDVDAGARWTLTDADLTSSSGGIGFPGVPTAAPTRAGVSSVTVSSSERVISELANYFGQSPTTASGDANLGAPGLALVGAASGETDVYFPALSSALSQTVFLYNPGVNAVTIHGTYYGVTGTVGSATYTVGPDQIQVIGQGVSDVGGTGGAAPAGSTIPANTMGAEFTAMQTRGSFEGTSAEPGEAPETFVAAAVTHSADNSNWWGTQGLYPLPTLCSTVTGCS